MVADTHSLILTIAAVVPAAQPIDAPPPWWDGDLGPAVIEAPAVITLPPATFEQSLPRYIDRSPHDRFEPAAIEPRVAVEPKAEAIEPAPFDAPPPLLPNEQPAPPEPPLVTPDLGPDTTDQPPQTQATGSCGRSCGRWAGRGLVGGIACRIIGRRRRRRCGPIRRLFRRCR